MESTDSPETARATESPGDLPDRAPHHDGNCEGCGEWAAAYNELIAMVARLDGALDTMVTRYDLQSGDLRRQLMRVEQYRTFASQWRDLLVGIVQPLQHQVSAVGTMEGILADEPDGQPKPTLREVMNAHGQVVYGMYGGERVRRLEEFTERKPFTVYEGPMDMLEYDGPLGKAKGRLKVDGVPVQDGSLLDRIIKGSGLGAPPSQGGVFVGPTPGMVPGSAGEAKVRAAQEAGLEAARAGLDAALADDKAEEAGGTRRYSTGAPDAEGGHAPGGAGVA